MPPASAAKLAAIARQGRATTKRDQPRKDQHADRVQPDHRQRIDLLAHLHRADFGSNGAARAAGYHDRRHQHAEFAQDQHADEIDDEDVGAEVGKLIGALLRHNSPNDKRHEQDNRYGADAHAVDLIEYRSEVDAMAAPELHLPTPYGGAQNVHRRKEIVAHFVDTGANGGQEPDDDVRFGLLDRPGRVLRGITNRIKQDRRHLVVTLKAGFNTLGLSRGNQAFNQPGACGIHPSDPRQVDNQCAQALAVQGSNA